MRRQIAKLDIVPVTFPPFPPVASITEVHPQYSQSETSAHLRVVPKSSGTMAVRFGGTVDGFVEERVF